MADNYYGFNPRIINTNPPPTINHPPHRYPTQPIISSRYPTPPNPPSYPATPNMPRYPVQPTSTTSYPSPPIPHPPTHHHQPPQTYPTQRPNYKPPQWGGNIVTGGNHAYYWADCSAHQRSVPPTAVHGGVDKDGTQIYVGRAFHEGDWIPAKVIPEKQVAYVPYGGCEHAKDSFQVLCEQRFDWVPSSGGQIPPGAVEGGRTESGEPLYVGRVWHDGAHTVGKVHPSHGACYIPYDSQELSFHSYEILVLRM